MKFPRLQFLSFLALTQLALLLAVRAVHADSATWNLNPTSRNWNTAANWTPSTVPNGGDQTAAFDLSSTTSLSVSANTQIGAIVFQGQAPAYSIDVKPGVLFSIGGAGVQNDSLAVQTLRPLPGPFGRAPGALGFVRTASAGTSVIDTLGGLVNFDLGAETTFYDHSTAGSATLFAEGAKASAAYSGGLLIFRNYSTAAQAIIIAGGGGGNGGVQGGTTVFTGNSSAENATVTASGGEQIGASGGQTQFSGMSTAGAAKLTAAGGSGGTAANISFFRASSGGTASIELLDDAYLDISNHDAPGMTIGLLKGLGSVFLGGLNLAIGSNGQNTVYSGSLLDGGPSGEQGAGSLTKIGRGRLSLSGANTYSGGTIVGEGRLVISNSSGSGTGTGVVNVNAGTLGGSGTIAGAVTVGTGDGPGAFLETNVGLSRPKILTIKSALIFASDGTYIWRVNTKKEKADKVVADGITIDSSAHFDLRSSGAEVVAVGTVFTVISNTSATSINGSFANLPNGCTLIAGPNHYQASYKGGDGNDLTLTAVP